MRQFIVCLLLVGVILGSGPGLSAQDLSLSDDVVLFLNPKGLLVSTGSFKLNGTSQVHGVEALRLTASDFIQLENANVRLKTGRLESGKSIQIPVGIQSKTLLTLQSQESSTIFQVGMDQNSDQEALPYVWIIEALSEREPMVGIEFSWEKALEPTNFSLKALVKKENTDWDLLLDQKVGESTVSLSDFSDFEQGGSVFTVKNFVRDLDEDEVPDIREIQTSTDLLDPSDYLDSDSDGVPDYVEDIQNTEKNNPISFLDTNEDNVPDYLAHRSPFSFLDLRDVAITWGNMNFLPLFQDSVLTMLGSGRLMKLPVSWDGSKVDVFARGSYPASGKLSFPRGVFNAYGKNPETNGIVLPKPAPTDILLSNNRFDAPSGPFEISIGRISTVDPADNIHWPGLPYGLEDNIYFKVENDMLVWRGEDPAAGRDNFKVVIRVTDRDLNTVDKLFEIKRVRPTIAELEVFNTFSPDEDGLNDTWGVPSLRYFQGVRIQIFDRGGERVFYTENPDIKWDGIFNNQPAPIGTYHWTIEVRETGKVRRGRLNLFRK